MTYMLFSSYTGKKKYYRKRNGQNPETENLLKEPVSSVIFSMGCSFVWCPFVSISFMLLKKGQYWDKENKIRACRPTYDGVGKVTSM